MSEILRLSQVTKASHGHCYETLEVLALAGARKSAMPLAEISLSHCDDGWRATHGFGFTSGDHWGSWSPVFAASPAHDTRADALAAEAERLRDHIKDREGPEADRIRRWSETLSPNLLDRMISQ